MGRKLGVYLYKIVFNKSLYLLLKLYTTDYKNTFVQYLYDGGEYNCVKWNKETAYDVRVYMPKQYPGSNLDIYCSHYKSGGDSTGGGTGNGGNPGSGNPGGGNKDETSGFDIVKVSVYGVTVAKNGGKPSGNYYHYYKWIAKTTGKIFYAIPVLVLVGLIF